MKTPTYDKILEIFSQYALASERESALRELFNLPAQEEDSQDDLAERIADSLMTKLKPRQEAKEPSPFYPTMANEKMPEREPLEGWSEDLRAFAKNLYNELKQEEE